MTPRNRRHGSATETSTDATSPTDTTSSTDGSPEPGEQPGSETPKPGLYEQKDGTVQAVGVLTYRDTRGRLLGRR
jgi:hypothetical protein